MNINNKNHIKLNFEHNKDIINIKVRQNCAEGRFYSSSRRELEYFFENTLKKELKDIKLNYTTKKIIGGIVPHAAYIFSGKQALHFFEILSASKQVFDTIIIINPNHSGYGDFISLSESDYWDSPFGKIEIDKEFNKQLQIPISEYAHKFEHSAEVMLPFLKYFLKYDFKIVPISFYRQNYENAIFLANEIYRVNKILNRRILIIASSDFSHYLPETEVTKLDDIAINLIKEGQSNEFYKAVLKYDMSICGYGPIISLMEYSKLVNQDYNSSVLSRGNSGEVNKDDNVVDYISMIFYQ